MITIATNPVTKRHMQQMVSFREHFCKGKKKKKTQLLHTMYKNYLSKVDILLTKLHV